MATLQQRRFQDLNQLRKSRIAERTIQPVRITEIPQSLAPTPSTTSEPTLEEQAFEQVQRAAQGKRTMVTEDIAPYYARLLENKEIREAVESGQSARISALQSGFTNVDEYIGVQNRLIADINKSNIEKFKSEGLNPVIQDGKIIAFEDTKSEIYSPQLGAFVNVNKMGGTAILRPPTYKESQAIVSAQYKGSARGISSNIPIIKDVVASKDLIDLKARQYQELTSNLNNLDTSQLNERIKQIKQIGGKVEKVENKMTGEVSYKFSEPTIKIGATKSTQRDVPVSQLSNQGLFRYSTGLFTGELGQGYKVIAKDIGISGYSTTTPEKEFYKVSNFGTGIYNPSTNKYESISEKIIIPEETKSYFTPEQIGKGVEMFGEGVLFVPNYFGGLGESTIVGSEFGGQKNVKEYVKAYPIETGILVSGGLFSAGTKITKTLKTPIIKQEVLTVMNDVPNPLSIQFKPTTRNIFFKEGKQYIQDTGGQYREVVKEVKYGRKTEVNTPLRDLFGMKPLSKEESLYKLRKSVGYDESEFIALNKIKTGLTKEEFVSKLTREGISKSRAEELFTFENKIKETLRTIKPSIEESYVKGEVTSITTEEKSVSRLVGKQTLISQKGEVLGVKFLQKKPKTIDIGIESEYIGESKSKLPSITSIGEREGEVELKLFRESLPKTEQAKFDKLDKLSKKYWMEQVNVGSLGMNMYRGKILSLESKKFSEQLDKGYSYLSQQGLLRKAKKTDFGFPLRDKSKDIIIKGTTEDITLQTSKFAKIEVDKANQLGKQSELFGGVSASKSLGETPRFNIFADISISRRLNPLKRKLELSKGGSIIEKGEPSITITDETIEEARGVMGGGKKSSKEFLQQMYKLKTIPIPKVTLTKTIIPKTSTLKAVVEPKTSMLPLVSASSVTTQDISSTILNPIVENVYTKNKFDSINVLTGKYILNDALIKEDTKVNELFLTAEELKDKYKIRDIFGDEVKIRQFEIQSPIESQKQDSALKLLQSLKQEQKQRMQQTTRQITTQKTKEQKIREPKKPFKFKFTLPSKTKGTTAKETLKDLYGVWVKKGGEDISLGKFETIGKAKEELFGTLREELRASGYVEKGGKKVRLNLFGTEFKPSKKDFMRVVQPKEKRLSTKGEVSEIKLFKKKGRKRFF
jgi:hypothetical protein